MSDPPNIEFNRLPEEFQDHSKPKVYDVSFTAKSLLSEVPSFNTQCHSIPTDSPKPDVAEHWE